MESDSTSSQDPKSDGSEPERRRTRNTQRKSGIGFAVAVSGLLVILFGSFYVLVVGIGGRASSVEYALLIDAGSSGSRMHLYKWLPEDDDRLPVITEIALDRDCNKVNHRLSELGGNVDTREIPIIDREPLILQVRESLKLLITCAQLGLTDRAADFQKIPLYLRATAGMRIARGKDKDRYYKIMEEVLAYLRSTPFHFGGARVIEGQEEALYAWVAANYLNGSLGKTSNKETIGILELGGASAQIAFVVPDSQSEETELVEIAGREYQVYARGYDGVGKTKIVDAFNGDTSCFPKNYEMAGGDVGEGNHGECQGRIIEFLKTSNQSAIQRLREDTPSDYGGKFLAISNYYHTPSFFGQKNVLNYKELGDAGSEYCEKDWKKILADNPNVPPKFLSGHCLMAAYIPALLAGGFRVQDDGRVMLRLDGSEAEVDWSLGALILLLH